MSATLVSCSIAIVRLMAPPTIPGAPPAPPPPEVAHETSPALEFRIDPLVDLVFLARSIDPKDATARESHGEDLVAAALAAAALDRALQTPLAWGLLSDMLIGAGTAATFAELCTRLPEEMETHSGPLRFREEAIAFATALAAAEPAFLSDLWPQRTKQLVAAQADIEASLASADRPWIPFVLEHLNMEDPQATIPVYLVGDAPWPGAVTHRSRAGGVCFVSIESAAGSQLVETVIHESIHALDSSTGDEPTALNQLREGLHQGGIAAADPLMRNLPHLLIFVQAAETTRRCIVPAHVDYGETQGVYARLHPGAEIVRANWRRYLDGEMDLAKAIRAICDRAGCAVTATSDRSGLHVDPKHVCR